MRDGSRIPATERGSAAVEFALVLPVLLLVMLAFIQVGLIARDQLLLVQSSRAGAREAAVDPDDAVVRTAAASAAEGLDPSRLEVSVVREASMGDPVAVTARYDVPLDVPLIDVLLPPQVTLAATSTMRQEFNPSP